MTTLDHNELLDLATKYSRENLRDFGEVPPTLIAATPDGIVIYNPEKLSSGDDMKQFALVAQLVVIGFSAHAVAIILQSWSLFSAGSGKPAVRPSDSPDRKEVVLISAESPSSEEQRLLFIQRDVMGTFTDFAPDDPRPFDEMEAPFARIYSSEVLSGMKADTARGLLKSMGIVVP